MSDDLRRIVVRGSTIEPWTPESPKIGTSDGVHWALADRFDNVVDIAAWGGGFHCARSGSHGAGDDGGCGR